MSERNPFEQQPKGPGSQHRAGRELRCEEWEALLADALDGVMPAADSANLRGTQQRLRNLRGAAGPVPAGAGVDAVSASRAGDAGRPDGTHSEPDERRGRGSSAGGIWRSHRGWTQCAGHAAAEIVWDTRLMMTAAMAFFSIALTLNLAGVRLTGLRLADLTPASLESNLTRQFYGAKSRWCVTTTTCALCTKWNRRCASCAAMKKRSGPRLQPKQRDPAAAKHSASQRLARQWAQEWRKAGTRAGSAPAGRNSGTENAGQWSRSRLLSGETEFSETKVDKDGGVLPGRR